MKHVVESFIVSFGILTFGFITIPLAAWAVGGNLSMSQGAGMSGIFFVLRWGWVYFVRRRSAKLDRILNPTLIQSFTVLWK